MESNDSIYTYSVDFLRSKMERNRSTPEEVKKHPWMRKFTKNWHPYLPEVSRQKRRSRRAINSFVIKNKDGKNTSFFQIELQLPKQDAKSIKDGSKRQKDYIDPTEDARLEVLDNEELKLSSNQLSWTIGNYVYVDPEVFH